MNTMYINIVYECISMYEGCYNMVGGLLSSTGQKHGNMAALIDHVTGVDATACRKDYFVPQRLPVTCHPCEKGQAGTVFVIESWDSPVSYKEPFSVETYCSSFQEQPIFINFHHHVLGFFFSVIHTVR